MMASFRIYLVATVMVAPIAIAVDHSACAQAPARSSPPVLQSPAQPSIPDQASPQQNDTPPASPQREENPGLLNEMGKLFEKSLSILPKMKTPSEAIDDLNARARDAGESLSNLAKPASVVSGRMGCAVAANGAPDCKSGADRLCQSKGFKEGKSLDTDAAEKCSAKVYLPGHKREPGDCRIENYVTRALCQ